MNKKKLSIFIILLALFFSFGLINPIKTKAQIIEEEIDGLSGDFEIKSEYEWKEDDGSGTLGPFIRYLLKPLNNPIIHSADSLPEDEGTVLYFYPNPGMQRFNTLYYSSDFYGWKIVFEPIISSGNFVKKKVLLTENPTNSLVIETNYVESGSHEDDWIYQMKIKINGTNNSIDVDGYLPGQNSHFRLYLEPADVNNPYIETITPEITAYVGNKPSLGTIYENAIIYDHNGNVLENVVIETTYKPADLVYIGKNYFEYYAYVDYLLIRKSFCINYIDNEPPDVTVNKTVYFKNNAKPGDVLLVENLLTITDNYQRSHFTISVFDSNFITVTDPGNYWVDLKVADNSGNYTIVRVNGQAVLEAPIISGPNSFYIDVKDFIDSRYIKSFYTASDSFDNDLSSLIEVTKDSYLNNGSNIGKYEMTLRVKDVAGNYSIKRVTINVVDGLKDYFIVENTICVSKNTKLSDEDITKALHLINKVQPGTVRFDFYFNEYATRHNEVGFKSTSEITGITQNNVSFPTSYVTIEVVDSTFFGHEHPNPIGKTMGTIVTVLIVVVVAYIVIKLISRTRKKKWGWKNEF